MRALPLALLLAAAALAAAQQPPRPTFELTAAQRAQGWEVLFDGTGCDAWRGYKAASFPEKGWSVEDGWLRVHAKGGGGDIVTRATFGDFELELTWKCAAKANSGIMYRVTEDHPAPWMSGPEYQILDDGGHGLDPDHLHSAGALYDLVRPDPRKFVRRGGPNRTRIRLQDGWLQHWLNGHLLLETRLGESFAPVIAGSKFKAYEGFGLAASGHVALQDHGDDVWFRDIRIRALDRPRRATIDLLQEDRYRVHPLGSQAFEPQDDGVMRCSGQPYGYLRSRDTYESFVLSFEWRWDAEPGNSGVLVRCQEPDRVWPTCIEAQLMAGSAGDFIRIGKPTPALDLLPQRSRGRRGARFLHAERRAGQWNHGEVVVNGPLIDVSMNGHLVNQGAGAEVRPGFVAFQSEGAPIHFRHLWLTPISGD